MIRTNEKIELVLFYRVFLAGRDFTISRYHLSIKKWHTLGYICFNHERYTICACFCATFVNIAERISKAVEGAFSWQVEKAQLEHLENVIGSAGFNHVHSAISAR